MNCAEIITLIETHLPARLYLPALISRLANPESPEAQDQRARVAVPTFPELQHLLKATREPEDALLLRTVYAAGLSQGEIVTLRVGGLDGHRLFLPSDARYVVVDPTTAELLQAWAYDQPLDRRLFPYHANQVSSVLKRWAKECGILQQYEARGERLSSQSLRHSAATHCYGRGMELPTVALMLGQVIPKDAGKYLHAEGIHLVAERYQAAWTRAPQPTRAWDRISRDDVVAYLRDTLPPTAPLDETIHALCLLRRDTLPNEPREWLDELGEELPLLDQVIDPQAPYVPPAEAVEALSVPLARFLYRSGIQFHELPQVRLDELDPATGILPVGARQVVIDPETAALTTPETLREPWETVLEAARRTGLVARFEGLGRRFTPTTLRHAYGVHLYEGGLDLGSLRALLHHRYPETTEKYLRLGVERWYPEYLRCHPLST